MTEIGVNPLLGTFLHAIGAFSAALCYTPQQKLRGWSWQTYWLAQASVCWLLVPVLMAWLTIPDLAAVLRAAPRNAMWWTFALGVIYGIGGTAFGMAIRHVGYSLTYGISIGISCVLGTLTGPILEGTLVSTMGKPGAGWVMSGVFVGLLGTLLCGVAGRLKEAELQQGAGDPPFVLGKGLLLCAIAGVFSAFYGIAVNHTGAPIAKTATDFGAGHWQTNIVYIFSNTGAFVTTAAYCIYLARSQGTFGEFRRPKDAAAGALPINYLMALLTGCMWYGQFLFYGLAHVRMGEFKFSSWAIHMLMLILFSSLAGIVLREWHGRSARTKGVLVTALLILSAAVVALTYGNFLGQ
ncbi:MAG TPA: L-rhamnose/proton symporter RhaT [Sedimentisphaerales bacterium]|jgi:L-rhamnose-H+ transport protein|nr:L-rhamnose/proton symporter RhaT [Sedimentisphaerales bacterium]HNU29542.1 L-rhamnose/proton symporter RhaT [Sedimentisphaerales bacterium]